VVSTEDHAGGVEFALFFVGFWLMSLPTRARLVAQRARIAQG